MGGSWALMAVVAMSSRTFGGGTGALLGYVEEVCVRGRGDSGGAVLGVERANGGVKVADLDVVEVGDVGRGEGDGGTVAVGGAVWKAELDRVDSSSGEGV